MGHVSCIIIPVYFTPFSMYIFSVAVNKAKVLNIFRINTSNIQTFSFLSYKISQCDG